MAAAAMEAQSRATSLEALEGTGSFYMELGTHSLGTAYGVSAACSFDSAHAGVGAAHFDSGHSAQLQRHCDNFICAWCTDLTMLWQGSALFGTTSAQRMVSVRRTG